MSATLEKTSRLYASTPESHKGEGNDCAVRALSIAANVPYPRAHALLARAGRRPRHGTTWAQSARVAPLLGGIPVSPAEQRGPSGGPVTLRQFIAAHPVGRYSLTRSGHAFALIDGEVHDWGSGRTGPGRAFCEPLSSRARNIARMGYYPHLNKRKGLDHDTRQTGRHDAARLRAPASGA